MVHLVINTAHIRQKHVCWFTKRNGSGRIELFEVVNRLYHHPDASEEAVVRVTETVSVDETSVDSEKAATWVLLEACQKAVTTANEGGD